MSVKRHVVMYLHGFNSSPASLKAQQFKEFCLSAQLAEPLLPALSYDPVRTMTMLHELMRTRRPVLVLGSSLGGYYATVLAEQYDVKAVLINPAVAPFENLADKFIGPQKNFHTGEEYMFTESHARALLELSVGEIRRPENYLVLLQTGDDVLDYRRALSFYQGARIEVQQGGSHSFENFEQVLPLIAEFAGLG